MQATTIDQRAELAARDLLELAQDDDAGASIVVKAAIADVIMHAEGIDHAETGNGQHGATIRQMAQLDEAVENLRRAVREWHSEIRQAAR